jgi:hypothetical protein
MPWFIATAVLAFLTRVLAHGNSGTPTWTNTDGHGSILGSGAFNLSGSKITAFNEIVTTKKLQFRSWKQLFW